MVAKGTLFLGDSKAVNQYISAYLEFIAFVTRLLLLSPFSSVKEYLYCNIYYLFIFYLKPYFGL